MIRAIVQGNKSKKGKSQRLQVQSQILEEEGSDEDVTKHTLP